MTAEGRKASLSSTKILKENSGVRHSPPLSSICQVPGESVCTCRVAVDFRLAGGGAGSTLTAVQLVAPGLPLTDDLVLPLRLHPQRQQVSVYVHQSASNTATQTTTQWKI